MVGRTRANISAAERSEQNDRITLQTMKTLAEAMGCRFVYAIVPGEGSIDDVLKARAQEKARSIVLRASTHMALEKQSLTSGQIEDEIERLALGLLRDPPPDFWEDE
jgi:predicted DNA-binding mobile mystery protein A